MRDVFRSSNVPSFVGSTGGSLETEVWSLMFLICLCVLFLLESSVSWPLGLDMCSRIRPGHRISVQLWLFDKTTIVPPARGR